MTHQHDQEVVASFVSEAKGYLPEIMLGLESFATDASQQKSLKEALRYAHIIKGAASLLGFMPISAAAYQIEVTLGMLGEEQLPLSQEILEDLCQNISDLADLLEHSLAVATGALPTVEMPTEPQTETATEAPLHLPSLSTNELSTNELSTDELLTNPASANELSAVKLSLPELPAPVVTTAPLLEPLLTPSLINQASLPELSLAPSTEVASDVASEEASRLPILTAEDDLLPEAATAWGPLTSTELAALEAEEPLGALLSETSFSVSLPEATGTPTIGDLDLNDVAKELKESFGAYLPPQPEFKLPEELMAGLPDFPAAAQSSSTATQEAAASNPNAQARTEDRCTEAKGTESTSQPQPTSGLQSDLLPDIFATSAATIQPTHDDEPLTPPEEEANAPASAGSADEATLVPTLTASLPFTNIVEGDTFIIAATDEELPVRPTPPPTAFSSPEAVQEINGAPLLLPTCADETSADLLILPDLPALSAADEFDPSVVLDVLDDPLPEAESCVTTLATPAAEIAQSSSPAEPLLSEEMTNELMETFLLDAEEHLQNLHTSLRVLYKNPHNRDLIQEVRRSSHSLKGTAAIVGLDNILQLAHRMEDVLDLVYDGALQLTQERTLLLMQATDALEDMSNGQANPSEVERLYHAFAHLLSSHTAAAKEPMPSLANEPATELFASVTEGMPELASSPEPSHEAESSATVSQSVVEKLSIELPTLEETSLFDVPETTPNTTSDAEVELSNLLPEMSEPVMSTTVDETAPTAEPAPATSLAEETTAITFTQGLCDAPTDEPTEEQVDEQASAMQSEAGAEVVTETAAEITAEATIELPTEPISEPTAVSCEAVAEPVEGAILTKHTTTTVAPPPVLAEPSALTAVAQIVHEPDVLPASPSSSMSQTSSQFVRVSIERLDDIVRLISEMIMTRTTFEQRLADFARQVEELQITGTRLRRASFDLESKYEASSLGGTRPALVPNNTRPGLPPSAALAATNLVQALVTQHTHGFDDLEFDRYTEFHLVSRELVESSTDIQTLGRELSHLNSDFLSYLNRQGRIYTDLQDRLMRLRMIPLAHLAPRLHRAVRTVSAQRNKEVELIFEGETTAIDTTALQEMADPLLHLLRNAVDHGIEAPDVRVARGKARLGQITLRAFYEGSQVVIQLRDDGQGLDLNRIRQRALQQGLITPAEAESMPPQELSALIFLPGFSTATQISEISGRGVGLDVVQTTVQKLKGTVVIDSQPQMGTTFTIRLPLTLAVTRSLMVKASGQTFAIPLDVVTQILRVEMNKVERIGKEPVVRLGGKVYPLLMLSRLLNLRQPSDEMALRPPALLLSVEGKEVVVIIDSVLGGREVVIKTLGNHLRKVHGVMGATLMGDGEVVLILNLAELLRGTVRLLSRRVLTQHTAEPSSRKSLAEPRPAAVSAPAPIEHPPQQPLKIMIVDDSPSVRRVSSNMIQNCGWVPMLAKDGLDALEQLQSTEVPPDLILLDIEMPRMDGYQFLGTIRSLPSYRHLPVVMLSSRSSEKHRQKAVDLGATEYLVKPYQEDHVLSLIRQLVNANQP